MHGIGHGFYFRKDATAVTNIELMKVAVKDFIGVFQRESF
jgi:hypothetical protein